MHLLWRILNSASPKTRPFAFTSFFAGYFLVAFLLVALPAILLIEGVPFGSWPDTYLLVLLVFTPIALAACVMAFLFGRLAYSDLHPSICAALFGIAMPFVVVGFLSISAIIKHGSFFDGLDTQKGQENALFLFLLFGFLGAALYWAGVRELREQQN